MRTMVIAEAGSCHDGQLDRLLDLVAAAADAQADVLKIQFWSDPEALADRRRVPMAYREVYRRYRVPVAWLPDVQAACHARGLRLGVTTYLPQDVAVVDPYTDVFKIASFEAECDDLFLAHRGRISQQRPLIISLGMGAVRAGWQSWTYYLRCVSAYPAPVEALQLGRLWPCHDGEGLCDCDHYDGLSDHTDPALTWTGALAVAAGAEIVEAHLRLAMTDPENPDAPHAMLPTQFRDYVRHIRFAETCLGADAPEQRGPLPCEGPMAQYKVRTS